MKNPSLHAPMCESKVACDGADLRHGRTICYSCQKALEKKARQSTRLRGENTAISQYERRGLPPRD